jgi:hypothetical protein
LCKSAAVLPWGEEVALGRGPVRLYCPNCEELFTVPSSVKAAKLDGAYFGPSFAHAFVLQHSGSGLLSISKDAASYTPKILGFRVAGQPGRPSLKLGVGLLAKLASSDRSGNAGSSSSSAGDRGGNGGGSGCGGAPAGGLAGGSGRGPFTTHYVGARPQEDDFFTGEEDLPSSAVKRSKQG